MLPKDRKNKKLYHRQLLATATCFGIHMSVKGAYVVEARLLEGEPSRRAIDFGPVLIQSFSALLKHSKHFIQCILFILSYKQ